MWFEAKAKIIYDPKRPGMKNRTSWWAVANLINGDGIVDYYRWWVMKTYGIELAKPSWGAHVSIIRGEKPSNGKKWGYRNGEIITLRYKHYPRITGDTKYVPQEGRFWFVDVDCPEIKEIRQYYDRPSNWNNHLTVGRVWNTIDTITERLII